MKVAELISALKEFPQNAQVEIQNGDDGGDYEGTRDIFAIEYDSLDDYSKVVIS